MLLLSLNTREIKNPHTLKSFQLYEHISIKFWTLIT